MGIPGLNLFVGAQHRGKTPVKNRFEFYIHSVRPVPKEAKEVKLIMIRGNKDKTRRVSELGRVVGDTGDWGEDALSPNNITLYMRDNGTFDQKEYNVFVKYQEKGKWKSFAKGKIDLAKFATNDRDEVVSKTLEIQLLKEAGIELKGKSKQRDVILRLTVKCYVREKKKGAQQVMTQITELASNIRSQLGPAGASSIRVASRPPKLESSSNVVTGVGESAERSSIIRSLCRRGGRRARHRLLRLLPKRRRCRREYRQPKGRGSQRAG